MFELHRARVGASAIAPSARPKHAQRHGPRAFIKWDELLAGVENRASGKAPPGCAGEFAQSVEVALGQAGAGVAWSRTSRCSKLAR